MALARRTEARLDPWRELDEMSRRLSRFFEGRDIPSADWSPSADISETDKEYRIRAALPDVKKDDVDVSLEGGVLTIRGERRARKEEKNETMHRVEIEAGTFLRSFSMPDDADPDKVDAKLENGVLDVTIAKRPEAKPETKKIEVH